MRKYVVVLCLLLASICQAITLGEIRADLRYSILDTTQTANNQRYTDAFLNYRINETQREVYRAALPEYASVYIDAIANQQEYAVSTDTLKIDKVVFLISTSTASYRKLAFSSIQSLDNDKGVLWEQLPPSQPSNYYLKGSAIGLVPAPSSTYAVSRAIKIYYYRMPTDMLFDRSLRE